MSMNIHVSTTNSKTVITFNQCIVNKKFFDLAEELGYPVRVTGGNFLTHEIECSEEDFKALQEMSH